MANRRNTTIGSTDAVVTKTHEDEGVVVVHDCAFSFLRDEGSISCLRRACQAHNCSPTAYLIVAGW